MVENSAVGLVMLEAGVPVTVTREEHHQAWLARYAVAPGGQRRVAVELAWCTIGAGKYHGQYAIEVRLDGQRVGELTYLMSRRYADVLGQVITHGGKPGCEAVIQLGNRGLEVVLHLPRDTSGVIAQPQTAVVAPQGKRPSRRPVWIAAAAVVFVFAVIGSLTDDSPSTKDSAASLTTTETIAPTTTTTVPATTTTTTTTTTTVAPPAPNPEPEPQPKPQPKPQPNPQPDTATQAPPPVAVQPAPGPACDPNYDGCVPIASDVDCEGGTGNGPAYVKGPVRIIGTDIYGLDGRDNDGIGCE